MYLIYWPSSFNVFHLVWMLRHSQCISGLKCEEFTKFPSTHPVLITERETEAQRGQWLCKATQSLEADSNEGDLRHVLTLQVLFPHFIFKNCP